jgi:MFS family permease
MLAQETPALHIDPATAGTLAGIGVALLLVVAWQLRTVPPKLIVLMATAFLDMVGVFLVLPLLPFYVKSLQQHGATVFGFEAGEGVLTALITTSYVVAQALSAPWWGRYSDRHGRRPALLIALAASAAAFVLFGFAESLWLLALSRIVQGAGGGTVGVIQAYVADAVPPEQRAKALGWLSAATNLGVTLGPVIGVIAAPLGELDLWPSPGVQSLGRAAPRVRAALCCVVNIVFAWRFLPESRDTKKHQPHVSTRTALHRVVANPDRSALRLLLTYGVAIGAAQGVSPTMTFFLHRRHGFDEGTIGYYFMYVGAISVFARSLVLGRAIDRFGEGAVSRVGIVTLGAAFTAIPFTHSLFTLALASALLPLGMALTFPCLTGLLTRIVPKDERGMYMGLQQTFGGFARLVAPSAYGVTYDVLGIVAPFWLAGGVVALTLAFGAGSVAVRNQLPTNARP